ncbi:MAG: cytochrome ubiquinol oxidase subunit I [Xanthomonadales bacterium PRO7]|jgi:cytochrome d ubiquinol oxidase subunit I|nr:cytochrome ubiquinol oxidase subunit I [Xanthomonadales bacterium PRO7]HMM56000.1 cytochrome ubiquinol oxidase subunit I [Rudaea sp.]
MDTTVLLSRLQFGFVISFHILFPAFTIGLASWLAFLEAWWLRTRDDAVRDLFFFWMKIFSVSFGVGVVTGIVMSFQFGTNWAGFSSAAGNVVGPLLNYEVLTAFFMEATFLGVMLFGWQRVSHRTHFFATCMVALGTLISTFWIISANSWMQTPAGYALKDGVFYPTDWWAVIFNPSFFYRLPHMVLAAFLTSAFVIGGVSAFYLARGQFADKARLCLKCALIFVAIVAPLQIFVGDLSGQEVREHQPAKLAAIEARWDTETNVPLTLLAIPNAQAERNDYALDVPHLGSLILTHSWSGEVKGLKDFAPADRPPVLIPFYAFRIMVGLGFAMLAVAWIGLWMLRRGTAFTSRWYLRAWMVMTPSGFVALVLGWWVAEVGRQPWVVYDVLRTADAVSPNITSGSVFASLTTYIATYLLLFGFATWYLIKMLRAGPVTAPPRRGVQTAARPLSLGDEELGDHP